MSFSLSFSNSLVLEYLKIENYNHLNTCKHFDCKMFLVTIIPTKLLLQVCLENSILFRKIKMLKFS